MFPCYSLHTSHSLLSPHTVSISLFSMSPLMPCKYFHQYHFSSFHIYALMYDICFSLSDLLHSYAETVQSLNCAQFFATPWTAAHQAPLVLHHLQEFAQTHVHWVSDAIQPLSPPSSLPSTLPNIRVFSNDSALCIRWLKYWSFGFSISPSNGIVRVDFL